MRLYTSGIEVPRLGSLKDRILRRFQMEESKKEIKKNSLLAFIAVHSPTFEDAGKAKEWSKRISTIWTEYSSLELGLEIIENEDDNKEVDSVKAMTLAYTEFVKKLSPQLTKENGRVVVKGLDALFVAHGEKPPSTSSPFIVPPKK
jgi:hypothetical protein